MLDVYYAGQSARKLGAIVNTITPMPRSQRRVTTYEVPGRSGLLHVEERGLEAVTRTLALSVRSQHAMDAVNEWCVVSGELVVTSEPGVYYKAYQYKEVAWKQITHRLFTAEITFETVPFRYLEMGRKAATFAEPGALFNAQSVESEPLIELTASGSVTLYVGNYVIGLTNLSGTTTIDSEMQMILRDGTSVSSDMRGDYPLLLPGRNEIGWFGSVQGVTIVPRWRKL